MFLELFVCLLLAHLVADFVLQSYRICKDKRDKKWCSVYHYLHAVIVLGLSWLVVFDVRFWWYALIIGMAHFAIYPLSAPELFTLLRYFPQLFSSRFRKM